MEPLSALAAACACVQFVEFGIKSVAACKEIYQKQTTTDLEGIEQRVAQLKDLEAKLTTLSPSANDAAIRRLCEQSVKLAKELGELLDRVQKSTRGPKVVQAAIIYGRTMREHGRLVELERKLEQQQQLLESVILLDIRKRIDLVAVQQDAAFQSLDDSSKLIIANLATSHTKLSELIERAKGGLESHFSKSFTDHRAVLENYQAALTNVVFREGSAIRDDLKQEFLSNQRREEILKSLYFPEIHARFEQIPSALEDTFEWIFKENDSPRSRASFRDWLRSRRGIFWINGIPASGKSTLMSFLVQHPRTLGLLEQWAGDEVLMPAFFFWKAGTALQKTIAGLLRSLLYQTVLGLENISRRCLIQLASGQVSGWSETRLSRCLLDILEDSQMATCFFVDGLDEFEGETDRLIQLCLKLSNLSNAKICVSSRPEAAFCQSFALATGTLALQELTRVDIEKYVSKRLKDFPRLKTFLPLICDKAHGVFLWVKLVVDSLVKGIQDGDDDEEISGCYSGLPIGLEELYSHMLQNHSQAYLQEAMQFFLFKGIGDGLLIYAVLGWDKNIARLFSETPLPAASDCPKLSFPAMVLRTRNRISSRCRGLLNFRDDHSTSIDELKKFTALYHLEWMHRTAKDFIFGPTGAEGIFQSYSERDLVKQEALEAMFRASATRFLFSKYSDLSETCWWEKEQVSQLLLSAAVCLQDYNFGKKHLAVLDAIKSSVRVSSRFFWSDVYASYAHNELLSTAESFAQDIYFVACAAEHGAYMYVQHVLQAYSEPADGIRPHRTLKERDVWFLIGCLCHGLRGFTRLSSVTIDHCPREGVTNLIETALRSLRGPTERPREYSEEFQPRQALEDIKEFAWKCFLSAVFHPRSSQYRCRVCSRASCGGDRQDMSRIASEFLCHDLNLDFPLEFELCLEPKTGSHALLTAGLQYSPLSIWTVSFGGANDVAKKLGAEGLNHAIKLVWIDAEPGSLGVLWKYDVHATHSARIQHILAEWSNELGMEKPNKQLITMIEDGMCSELQCIRRELMRTGARRSRPKISSPVWAAAYEATFSE